MNDSDYNQLREQSWRRKLTPVEQAELRDWLTAHPALRAEWETEPGLTEAIARLPNVPVPTNFTARVLQAVELEASANRHQQTSQRKFSWHALLPRIAIATVVLSVGLFTVHEQRTHQRARLAQSVATVSGVASLPGPDILQDFDMINQMDHAAVDKELLALMQ
jgi:hypothetical protein